RVQMTEDSQVRDRRYHLRKYRKCVIGREAVDWLLKRYHVQSRDEAVRAMKILQENGLIRHGSYNYYFEITFLFLIINVLLVFVAWDRFFFIGLDIFFTYSVISRLKFSASSVMRDFYHKGIHYKEAFYGCDAVDCVTAAEGFPDRDGIIKDFRDLLEKDIIKH
ncbi:hypothetical protein EGW08_007067, partial [Elysia chlorotica]